MNLVTLKNFKSNFFCLQAPQKFLNGPTSFENFSNLKPLPVDTVSFQGIKKNQTQEEIDKNKVYFNINGRVAANLSAEYGVIYPEFVKQMKKIFGECCAIDGEIPKNCVGTLKTNKKSDRSIREKCFSAERILTLQEAKNEIRDIARARIVLDTGSSQEFQKVCTALLNAYKCGEVDIVKIKEYANDQKHSYFNSRMKNEFEGVFIAKKGEFSMTTDKKSSGYHAVHIIFDLGSGYFAELQIMGKNIERLKEVEDILYKLSDGKIINRKYKDVLEAYEKLNLEQKKELQEYTHNVFLHEREKEMRKQTNKENFLSLPESSSLPRIFDFNNIERLNALPDEDRYIYSQKPKNGNLLEYYQDLS